MSQVLRSAGQAEPSAAERERAEETTRRSAAEQYRTYVEGKSTRRLVGFSVFIPLWVLSVVPLARESMAGRESVDALFVYLAVGAITLGVAAVIRSVYVSLTRARFWSPLVFMIAAVVALAGYTVQSAGEDVPVAGAQAAESRAE
jgi:cation transport ATPase